MSYDVITFGSATLDVFLEPDTYLIKKIRRFRTRRGLCFPFPSKVDIKGLDYRTGGGGTNTAASFTFQGLKAAYAGAIGYDWAGKKVEEELAQLGVETEFLTKTRRGSTNVSIIFSQGRDRACFVWRGASEFLEWEELDKKKLKQAKWFYLAPLSGRLSNTFMPITEFAKENGVKVFANPGNSQIEMGLETIKPILADIDILLLNQEEASLLTGVSYKKEKKVFKKLDELTPGLAIMTKGKKGAVASDGEFLWKVSALKTKVEEKTGAGDAFGSGFLTGLIRGRGVEFALQLGIANSTSCIREKGAKRGLLKKKEEWKKAEVRKKELENKS